MKKYKKYQDARFPERRLEFAGELTPDLAPGPITGAHTGRFLRKEPKSGAETVPLEDDGIWVRKED